MVKQDGAFTSGRKEESKNLSDFEENKDYNKMANKSAPRKQYSLGNLLSRDKNESQGKSNLVGNRNNGTTSKGLFNMKLDRDAAPIFNRRPTAENNRIFAQHKSERKPGIGPSKVIDNDDEFLEKMKITPVKSPLLSEEPLSSPPTGREN